MGADRAARPRTSPRASGAGPARAWAAGEDIALLVYASGTTGVPRGIRLSHRALLANRAQTAALRPAPVTPVDRVLLSLPLFHIFGLARRVPAGVLGGRHGRAHRAARRRRRSPTSSSTQRVSALAGVPSMFRALLDLPADELRTATAGVRLCTSGGAPLPPEWLAAFQQATGLAIVEGYGLTEAGPIVTTNPFGGAAQAGLGRPRAAGRRAAAGGRRRAAPSTAATTRTRTGLDDAQDTGLVAVRGPNLFSGYWPDGAGGPDAEGWFRTADVGFLDADGDLHLVDRSSDVVIVNGFNVYPREVEQVLLAIEGVTEAAVVGQRDERAGEVGEGRAGHRTRRRASTRTAVRAFCAQRLARFKVPAVIDVRRGAPAHAHRQDRPPRPPLTPNSQDTFSRGGPSTRARPGRVCGQVVRAGGCSSTPARAVPPVRACSGLRARVP